MLYCLIRLKYQTVEFGALDIHVRGLRDVQEFPADGAELTEPLLSSSNWALFGVLWESSRVLAHLMCDYDIEGRRILEVGCGLGLASLVLNARGADISATDYHPETRGFLAANVDLNQGQPIPFAQANWLDGNCGLGTFDLIIGSDLLYERGHAELLSVFVNANAKAACEVLLVDPGRGQMGRMRSFMSKFGYGYVEHDESLGQVIPPRTQIASYYRG